MNFTTSFTGWADATGNSGVLLPLAYETRLSYRNVDFLKLYVDAYQLDTMIAESRRARRRAQLRARAAVVPGADDHVAAIGKGVWRVDQGGTTVIEFRDHIVLFELGVNVDDRQGGDRARAHAGARQAGDASDHEPQPLRSHGGAAAGGRRRADDRAAPRQRAAVPRHGGARGAGFSRRPRAHPEAAQVPGGGRAPAHGRRHADARHLLGAQQRPHGGRAGRLHRRRSSC